MIADLARIDPETTWLECAGNLMRGRGDGYCAFIVPDGFMLVIYGRPPYSGMANSVADAATEARDVRRLVMGVPRG